VDDGQERSGRLARSRRWVQLRDATARTSDAHDTDAAQGGHGPVTDDRTKPATSRRTATASVARKRKNPHRDARTKPVEPEQTSVEADRKPTESEQKPGETNQKPVEAERKPTEAEQKPIESKQEPTEPKQEPIESKQEPTESKQEPTESKQEPTKAKQEPTKADKNSAGADRSAPRAGRAGNTAPCGDPLAALWELALLPQRMTMAATTEALKMLTSSDDGTHPSPTPERPQLDERDGK
jgi:hypothetical protein